MYTSTIETNPPRQRRRLEEVYCNTAREQTVWPDSIASIQCSPPGSFPKTVTRVEAVPMPIPRPMTWKHLMAQLCIGLETPPTSAAMASGRSKVNPVPAWVCRESKTSFLSKPATPNLNGIEQQMSVASCLIRSRMRMQWSLKRP